MPLDDKTVIRSILALRFIAERSNGYTRTKLKSIADVMEEQYRSADKAALYTSVRNVLDCYMCQYTNDADECALPLVDMLSPSNTIKEGQEEIHLIACAIVSRISGPTTAQNTVDLLFKWNVLLREFEETFDERASAVIKHCIEGLTAIQEQEDDNV